MNLDDCEIITLFFERSEAAITETALKYAGYCKRIAMNILSNCADVEECINDTYLHAWNSIPPQYPSLFSAYLGKITRNLSLNKYKQQKALKRGSGEVELLLHELEECIPSPSNVEKEYQEGTTTKAISNFLYSLDKLKRTIFIRRYWYGDSIAQISNHFKMSESKVKSMLFRIRNKLRIFLEKEGIDL